MQNKFTGNLILKSLIFGAILGFLLAKQGGLLFIGFVFLLILILLHKHFTDRHERNFVIAVFILSFVLRALLCVGFHIYNEASGNLYHYMGYTGNCIFGDSAAVSVISQALANVWHNQQDPMQFFSYMKNAHFVQFYICGIFYYLVGNYELPLKFINIAYGTISGIFVYLIAKKIFNEKVAKISYVATMFFPSLVLWSIANLKEPIQTLVFSVFIYSLLMLKEKTSHKTGYFFLSALMLFFTYTISRPEMAALLLAGGIIGFFLSINTAVKKVIFLALLCSLAGFLSYCLLRDIDIILILKLKIANLMQGIINWQSHVYLAKGHNYKIFPDRFYAFFVNLNIAACFFSFSQLLRFVFKAIILFMTVPLPTMMTALMPAVVFPQILFWYSVLIFFVFGFILTIIKNNRKSFFMAGFLIALIIPMSLVSANIGSTFRHRDLFTPFIIIYASYGLYWLLKKTQMITDGKTQMIADEEHR